MIQEIAQSIKEELHKPSFVLQYKQKYGLNSDDEEKIEQFKMIIREIIPKCAIKLTRTEYNDNQLNNGLNIQEVYPEVQTVAKQWNVADCGY